MADYITIIKGEAKTWRFTAVDASSSAVALSSASFILTVEKEGAATLLSKNSTSSGASFVSSSYASGIVGIKIGASSTLSWSVAGSSVPVPAGYYTCQLRTRLSATNIDKYKFNLDLQETL